MVRDREFGKLRVDVCRGGTGGNGEVTGTLKVGPTTVRVWIMEDRLRNGKPNEQNSLLSMGGEGGKFRVARKGGERKRGEGERRGAT